MKTMRDEKELMNVGDEVRIEENRVPIKADTPLAWTTPPSQTVSGKSPDY